MSQLFSIKSAAMLFVATAVMCFSGLEQANAQCGGRGNGYAPSYGRSSIGYSSGYRGGGYGGYGGGYNSGFGGSGYNRGSGISINLGRSYQQPYSRNRGSYGNSFSRSRFGY